MALRLLLVNLGWVGAASVIALVVLLPFNLGKLWAVMPFSVAILVSMQFLAWMWWRVASRRPGPLSPRSMREKTIWYLTSIALGAACAFLSGFLLGVANFSGGLVELGIGTQQGTPSGAASTARSVLETLYAWLFVTVLLAPAFGATGVMFGFVLPVIPLLSPLVVLSWEWVARREAVGPASAGKDAHDV